MRLRRLNKVSKQKIFRLAVGIIGFILKCTFLVVSRNSSCLPVISGIPAKKTPFHSLQVKIPALPALPASPPHGFLNSLAYFLFTG
jgi:hypothetical protein